MIVIYYRLKDQLRQRRVVLRDHPSLPYFEVCDIDAAGGERWSADERFATSAPRVPVLAQLLYKMSVDVTPAPGVIVRTDVGELL